MAALGNWQIAPARQPQPGDYRFDLDRALAAVVGITTTVPEDAFTAETLGTERAGHGVLIRDGVVLTIGYLITEAEQIWLALSDGRVVAGHPLAYDQETGFGLVQALAHVDLPTLPLGRSATIEPGTRVVVGAAGGRRHALSALVVGKQEFAGYWEYVLDEALFIAPAHPFWGGTALIGPDGDLIGIGSLQIEQRAGSGESGQLNMVVPIDLLRPILDDLMTTGRTNRPPRPWLGLYATEMDGRIAIVGLAKAGPAERVGLETGDLILSVAGEPVSGLAGFFRKVWTLGQAGVEVPLQVYREGASFAVSLTSADRNRFLKSPRLHS
jgi:S1-C subfamily serine protease